MTRSAQNKSTLNSEKQKRQTYGRFLPSLELKQQQLLAERRLAIKQHAQLLNTLSELQQQVKVQLPMLAASNIELKGLVKVVQCRIESENLVGVVLPRLGEITLERINYGFLARPHWVENLADLWEEMLRLRLQQQVMARRVDLLQNAVRKVTQRVNLFAKVLIPHADKNIKRIGLFLSDQERAAVVRSKLAKQRHGVD